MPNDFPTPGSGLGDWTNPGILPGNMPGGRTYGNVSGGGDAGNGNPTDWRWNATNGGNLIGSGALTPNQGGFWSNIGRGVNSVGSGLGGLAGFFLDRLGSLFGGGGQPGFNPKTGMPSHIDPATGLPYQTGNTSTGASSGNTRSDGSRYPVPVPGRMSYGQGDQTAMVSLSNILKRNQR